MDITFLSSGHYDSTFYKDYEIDFCKTSNCSNCSDNYIEKVSYNSKLLIAYYQDGEDPIYRSEIKQNIDSIVWDEISGCYYVTPKVFNEKIALKCGFIPFKFGDKNLLALQALSVDLRYMLDAYQLLTSGTIDPQSIIFTCSYNKKYFEDIVGKDLTTKVMMMK